MVPEKSPTFSFISLDFIKIGQAGEAWQRSKEMG